MDADALGDSELAFLSPDRLLILLVIPLLVLGLHLRDPAKNRRGMRFTNTSMLDVVVPKQSQWRRHRRRRALAAQPDHPDGGVRPAEDPGGRAAGAGHRRAGDRRVAVDAGDRRASRPGSTRPSRRRWTSSRQLPEKYNVPVVSMAGNPAILVPPTTAHNTVENAINSIKLQESTAIGEGITTALRALQQAPKDPKNPDAIAPGAIVHAERREKHRRPGAQQAAAEAKAAKVPIYTIAYGTENGYVDLDGKREPSRSTMSRCSRSPRQTGGDYFAAATADQLKKVYTNIGSEVGYEKADREVTARFAGYGLAFAVLAALGAISLGREVASDDSAAVLSRAGHGSGCCCLIPRSLGSICAGSAQAATGTSRSGGPCSTS